MIVYSVFGIPLGVLVMTGFFAVLPHDLEDAARIDGASHFEIFWRIMLPLTRPALPPSSSSTASGCGTTSSSASS